MSGCGSWWAVEEGSGADTPAEPNGHKPLSGFRVSWSTVLRAADNVEPWEEAAGP